MKNDVNHSVIPTALFTTVKEFEVILTKNATRSLRIPGLSDYISNYALLKLINLLPSQPVYNKYEFYIEQIKKRVHWFITHSPQYVLIKNRVSPETHKALENVIAWAALNPNQKTEACRHILISRNESHRGFIDLRYLQESTSTGYWLDNDFAHSKIYSDAPATKVNPWQQLTPEDIALLCVKHIAEKDKNAEMSEKKFLASFTPLAKKEMERKNKRNENRTDKLIAGITLATLLKRIRTNKITNIDKLEKANRKRVRLNNADFTPVLLDVIISSIFSGDDIKLMLTAKNEQQTALLKTFLVKSLRQGAIESAFTHVFLNHYTPPFLLDIAQFANRVSNKLSNYTAFTQRDITMLRKISITRIKRLPATSEADTKMLNNMDNRRITNAICTSGVTVADILNQSYIAQLYLAAQDIGISRIKIRQLLKSIYEIYLPEINLEVSDTTYRLARQPAGYNAHDILLSHELHLYELFSKWSRLKSHNRVINHIASLLISQINGAQGDAGAAFKNWNLLYQLCGKEEALIEQSPKNLLEYIAIAKRDPVLMSQVSISLAKHLKTADEIENTMLYAENTVGMRNFAYYLKTISQNTKLTTAKIPALQSVLSKELHNISIDIRPAGDILGSLGAGVQGVCIDYAGHSHLSHRNQALANVIVRDKKQIYLWGLLVRVQSEQALPTYLLNNLQGRLTSEFAKYKIDICEAIVELITSIGDVHTVNFNFNAISLINSEHLPSAKSDLIAPSLRLDIRGKEVIVDEEKQLQITDNRLYVLPCPDADIAKALHHDATLKNA